MDERLPVRRAGARHEQKERAIRGLIVHEWVEQRGGSENVLEAIADAFPHAPVLVPWTNAPERLAGHQLHQSLLAHTPIRNSKPLAALVLPIVWRTVVPRSQRFDWVIASSHLFSHHVRVPGAAGDASKFVYVHSPARYIWNPELDDRGAGRVARAIGAALKPIDRHRAQEAHRIAANSSYVRQRIERAWGRDATVIHPPVDVDRVRAVTFDSPLLSDDDRRALDGLPETFLLGASRFVSYKQLDVALRAGELAGLPVVLAGAGPDESALRQRAVESAVPVHFVLAPDDAMLYALYRKAAAYVFPAVEDFGIMPVEAMAAGTPVVARRAGGTGESIVDGVSGALLDDDGDDALRAAVDRAMRLDPAAVSARADDFSTAVFQTRLREWVEEGLRG